MTLPIGLSELVLIGLILAAIFGAGHFPRIGQRLARSVARTRRSRRRAPVDAEDAVFDRLLLKVALGLALLWGALSLATYEN